MACNCAANGPDKEKYAQLDAFIDSLPTTKGELIRVLHTAQGIFGYLPKEVQIYVAKRLNVPVSKVYGVVSFYSFFTMNDLMMFMEGATDEQKMASYEIKESVLVTLAGPMNFYVQ